MTTKWPHRNARVTVTSGPYAGQHGKALRPDGTLHGRPGWLVHLDGRFGGAFVAVKDMHPERAPGARQ